MVGFFIAAKGCLIFFVLCLPLTSQPCSQSGHEKVAPPTLKPKPRRASCMFSPAASLVHSGRFVYSLARVLFAAGRSGERRGRNYLGWLERRTNEGKAPGLCQWGIWLENLWTNQHKRMLIVKTNPKWYTVVILPDGVVWRVNCCQRMLAGGWHIRIHRSSAGYFESEWPVSRHRSDFQVLDRSMWDY